MTKSTTGVMNQMNMSGTLNMQTFAYLDRLFEVRLIEDYTDDGWVQLQQRWYPAKIACEKLGDNIYNEYLKYCRQ
jgi:hypothetical protein